MNKDIYKVLESKLSADVMFFNSDLQQYCTDKSYLSPIVPQVVVKAKHASDVREVLLFANEFKIPVTVRGAGSGKSGGAIPEFQGIVLSVELMNNILEVDTVNSCITVEPGVILDDIKQEVSQHGLFYPVETSSSDWCTIGGNVAANSGGANSLRYGVTKDYVLSLEGYFANGTHFRLGRKCYKDVAGYNLKDLLIGSEGTLAVINKITLKLIAKPKFSSSYWLSFHSLEKAMSFLKKAKVSGINFSAAEFMEPQCLDAAQQYLQQTFDFSSGYAVLLSYDADCRESLQDVTRFLSDISLSSSYRCKLFTQKSDLFWLVRRSISESLAYSYKNKFSEDITVPIGQISNYFKYIKSLQTDSIKIVGYGHLGDGNIHTNLLNVDLDQSVWHLQKEKLIDDIMAYCVSVGGTLSGEHGIGLTKKKYMNLYFSEFEILLMKQIKKQIDPNLILNPSKLFSF